MKIGDLARLADTPVQTIRYYEREGLLPMAARTAANYRQYGPGHRERLGLIRRCRALDMNLAEIRELLALIDGPAEGCGEVNALLDHHLDHVTRRIAELRALRSELQALRARCAAPASLADCGIVRDLRQPVPAARGGAAADHPPGAHRRPIG